MIIPSVRFFRNDHFYFGRKPWPLKGIIWNTVFTLGSSKLVILLVTLKTFSRVYIDRVNNPKLLYCGGQ